MKAAAELLDSGAAVDGGRFGITPLWEACKRGHMAMAALLVEARANIEAKSTVGSTTPLIAAAAHGHVWCLEYLLKHRADPSAVSVEGRGATSEAAREGHCEVLELIVAKKGNIEERDEEGLTPLLQAARFGHLKAADLLVQHGASVTDIDANGETLLHLAASSGNSKLAALALSKGINIEATTKTGDTALIEAARAGQLDMVKFLVETGHANVQARNTAGRTARQEAVKNGQESVAEYLYTCGNAQDGSLVGRVSAVLSDINRTIEEVDEEVPIPHIRRLELALAALLVAGIASWLLRDKAPALTPAEDFTVAERQKQCTSGSSHSALRWAFVLRFGDALVGLVLPVFLIDVLVPLWLWPIALLFSMTLPAWAAGRRLWPFGPLRPALLLAVPCQEFLEGEAVSSETFMFYMTSPLRVCLCLSPLIANAIGVEAGQPLGAFLGPGWSCCGWDGVTAAQQWAVGVTLPVILVSYLVLLRFCVPSACCIEVAGHAPVEYKSVVKEEALSSTASRGSLNVGLTPRGREIVSPSHTPPQGNSKDLSALSQEPPAGNLTLPGLLSVIQATDAFKRLRESASGIFTQEQQPQQVPTEAPEEAAERTPLSHSERFWTKTPDGRWIETDEAPEIAMQRQKLRRSSSILEGHGKMFLPPMGQKQAEDAMKAALWTEVICTVVDVALTGAAGIALLVEGRRLTVLPAVILMAAAMSSLLLEVFSSGLTTELQASFEQGLPSNALAERLDRERGLRAFVTALVASYCFPRVSPRSVSFPLIVACLIFSLRSTAAYLVEALDLAYVPVKARKSRGSSSLS